MIRGVEGWPTEHYYNLDVERSAQIIPFSGKVDQPTAETVHHLPPHFSQGRKAYRAAPSTPVPPPLQRTHPRLPQLPQEHLPALRSHLLPTAPNPDVVLGVAKS